MKLLLQILVSLFLHPLAMLLMFLNLIGRDDIDGAKKFIWVIIALIWGIGPILYILIGDGALW
jgi:hypothetical protein